MAAFKVSGTATTRHKIIQGSFYPLVLTIQQELPILSAKLFQVNLISGHDKENASNLNQPEFERASALLSKIMKKIELDQTKFEILIAVLREVPATSDAAMDLESSLKKEDESSNPLPLSRTRSVERSRRYSDSDAMQSKTPCLTQREEADSGVPSDMQTSSYCDGDNLLKESEVIKNDKPGQTVDRNGSSALVVSHLQAVHNDSALLNTPEDRIIQLPIARSSSDGKPPQLPSFSSGRDWNHKMENTYLKSVNQQHITELSDLKKTIEQLEEDKEICSKKLKEQGIIINQKDNKIDNLKKECAEKDKRVDTLVKDKAEMEKTIHDLQIQCTEAKEEIKSIHEAYKDKIAQLQKNLEEVQSSEQEAKIDLANAKAQLAEAKLEKEKELSKLKEDHHKLEKIKSELAFKLTISREKRKTELATKDKEIAELKGKHDQEKRRMSEQEAKELREQLASLRLRMQNN